MGCDIHTYAEVKNNGKYEILEGDWTPFNNRDYGLFGFLADVRNYSGIKAISNVRGFPCDISFYVKDSFYRWELDAHSVSWLSVDELINYDYEQEIEDLRCTREISKGFFDGGCTAKQGEGRLMSLRDFLGESFFEDLDKLKTMKVDRIIFWFDN